MVSEIVAPPNARCPLSISYSTHPKAQMSVRLSSRLAARLLGAHVRRGAEHDSLARPGHLHRGLCRVSNLKVGRRHLGEAKIEHFDEARGCDLHVRGFEVAMDDAPLVRGIERIRDLSGRRQRFGYGNRAAHQPVGQRIPFDEFQDESPHPHAVARRRILESVDRADMGMVQRGQDPRLALEPREPIGIVRDIVREGLDGDVPLELRIAGAVDLAHSADTQQ